MWSDKPLFGSRVGKRSSGAKTPEVSNIMPIANELKFKQYMKAINKADRLKVLKDLEESIIELLNDNGTMSKDQKKSIVLQLFEFHLDETEQLKEEIARIKAVIDAGQKLDDFIIKRGLTIEQRPKEV